MEIRDSRIQRCEDGRRDQQLTCTGNNYHLYFTENSFDAQNEIIFLSDRASGQDRLPQDDPHYNLFRMNLETGEIVQMTDEPDSVGSVTKTPDSQIVVYKTGNQIKKLDTATGRTTIIYEERATTASARRRSRAIAAMSPSAATRRWTSPRGPNYTGFKESFYLIKDGRITVAYLDGSAAGLTR